MTASLASDHWRATDSRPGPDAADPSQDCDTCLMPDPLLAVLSKRTGWAGALKRLHDLYDEHGTDAAMSAEGYADRYKGRRAAMVFDAVASRQRKYELVVLPWVAIFDTEPASASLAALSTIGPSSAFHLRTGEAETMRSVADGLLRFGVDNDLGDDDDDATEAWAGAVEALEVVPSLDPYVGSVKGIGVALFRYLRMRSGADAIKPDVRVRKAVERLGFTVPAGAAALLAVSTALATELGISRLVLDQLLWSTLS